MNIYYLSFQGSPFEVGMESRSLFLRQFNNLSKSDRILADDILDLELSFLLEMLSVDHTLPDPHPTAESRRTVRNDVAIFLQGDAAKSLRESKYRSVSPGTVKGVTRTAVTTSRDGALSPLSRPLNHTSALSVYENGSYCVTLKA